MLVFIVSKRQKKCLKAHLIYEISQPVASCGPCLQVLAEYEKKQNMPIQIILFCNNGPAWVMNSVESFLPFLFFENGLLKEVKTER